MLRLQIPKNRMNYLIGEMQSRFDVAQIERGWELYHKGRVSGIELVFGTEIHALLRENKAYDVILDLDDFGKSECSCASEPVCEHMAAALFSLYMSFGRPELLYAELKQTMLVKAKQQQSRRSALRGDKKQELVTVPEPDRSPADWIRYFDQQFYGFSVSHQTSIEAFYQTAWDRLTPVADEWPEPVKTLYTLHVVMFIMRKLEQFYTDSKTSYLSYHHETGCKAAAKSCMEEAIRIAPGLDGAILAARHAEGLQETIRMLREAALEAKESPVDWLAVYRLVWSQLAGLHDWQEREKRLAQSEADKPDVAPRRKDTLLLCLAHFDVIRGDDAAAVKRLQDMRTRNVRDFFIYFRSFQEQGQWDRMLRWLRWCLPAVQRAPQDEFQLFCQYWTEAVQHQPTDEEWVDVMVALLPRTYYFYTAYLLKTKRFKQWVDLQVSHRISPVNLYAAELKAVESHDPSLLLPMYHQAAERCIAEKNRVSYKTAIKLLKKLNSYYKELGMNDRWDEFIGRLTDKYSRLRAFQEELKKGKWLS